MQANTCRIKVLVSANQVELSAVFEEWARTLPDSAEIEGQPALGFSSSLQKFHLTCLYSFPLDNDDTPQK